MANARDDLYNGASRPTIEATQTLAEQRQALDEFNTRLPDFCRRLDIPPSYLTLRTPELLMLVCIRQQAIIDDLAAQVSRLAFPPAQE